MMCTVNSFLSGPTSGTVRAPFHPSKAGTCQQNPQWQPSCLYRPRCMKSLLFSTARALSVTLLILHCAAFAPQATLAFAISDDVVEVAADMPVIATSRCGDLLYLLISRVQAYNESRASPDVVVEQKGTMVPIVMAYDNWLSELHTQLVGSEAKCHELSRPLPLSAYDLTLCLPPTILGEILGDDDLLQYGLLDLVPSVIFEKINLFRYFAVIDELGASGTLDKLYNSNKAEIAKLLKVPVQKLHNTLVPSSLGGLSDLEATYLVGGLIAARELKVAGGTVGQLAAVMSWKPELEKKLLKLPQQHWKALNEIGVSSIGFGSAPLKRFLQRFQKLGKAFSEQMRDNVTTTVSVENLNQFGVKLSSDSGPLLQELRELLKVKPASPHREEGGSGDWIRSFLHVMALRVLPKAVPSIAALMPYINGEEVVDKLSKFITDSILED